MIHTLTTDDVNEVEGYNRLLHRRAWGGQPPDPLAPLDPEGSAGGAATVAEAAALAGPSSVPGAERLPSHPPPYFDDDMPMTWSSGSIHGIFTRVMSIHTSVGMGKSKRKSVRIYFHLRKFMF